MLVTFTGFSQVEVTTYRGAFAPAPTAMWSANWSNFDPQNVVYPATNVTINTDITTNTTWTAGNVYLLAAQVFVKNNAILTIEPGTIIRGDKASKGSIIVTKGSKLIAEGTEALPIIFTSNLPVGSRQPGDWGGVILLGNSTYNGAGGSNNIEGLVASPDSLFGGGASPVLNDNSGSLKYVRIEFPGVIFSMNNEINGLTFGGVGSGTTIDYIQVSYSGDDSYEWFGGTVNCKHLIAFSGTDDDYDTDFGYSGAIQFALGIRDPLLADTASGGASEGFESDNNNTTGFVGTPKTGAVFTNFTMLGPSFRASIGGAAAIAQHQRAARIRRNSALKVYNSVFMDYKGGLFIENVETETNAFTDNTMKWQNNILAGTVSSTPVLSTTPANSTTLANWYTTNNNSTVATNAGILTSPYDTSNGNSYTGRDYRPATSSPALTGASFTDPVIAALGNESYENASISSSVYPNPSATNFKISFASSSSSDVKVSVYDITGRTIETKTVTATDINNYEFGTNYDAGMYIVVVNQTEVTKSFKVVKN